MGEVWALNLPPTEKLVLLALADNANDDGTCWPSVATISGKTSLAERTVRGVIHRLQRTGYVSITERHGRSHVFVVATCVIDALPLHQMHPSMTCTPAPDAPTTAAGAPPPLHDVHPTPASGAPITIKEPSSEPSRNRHQSSLTLAELPVKAKRVAEIRGTKIPIPFEVTAAMRAWAAEHTPHADIKAVTEEFIDYWKGVPGQRGRKSDWEATWRNRMREKATRKFGIAEPRKTHVELVTERLEARINGR